MIQKIEIENLMQIKGNVRGGVIQANVVFIRGKTGEEGLKAIENKMAEFGYPFEFNKIKIGEWYPEALSVSIILVAKDLFNWTEKDIFEMGNSAPKYSFISKVVMRYFLSLERIIKEIPNYWKNHFDFGELESYKFSEEEKYLILHEKGYKFHPLLCIYHSGYFLRIAQFAIKSKEITVEETKCMFKEYPYHEYIIKWV